MRLLPRVARLLALFFVFSVLQPAAAQGQRKHSLQEGASFERGAPFAARAFVAEPAETGSLQRSVVLKSTHRGSASARRRSYGNAFRADSSETAKTIGASITLGVVGGAVGFFAGGLAGASIEQAFGCESEFLCGVAGGVLGALTGEAAGLALGVHLGSGRRGHYPSMLLSAAGVSVAGIFTALVAEEAAVLLAIPAVQLIATVPTTRPAP